MGPFNIIMVIKIIAIIIFTTVIIQVGSESKFAKVIQINCIKNYLSIIIVIIIVIIIEFTIITITSNDYLLIDQEYSYESISFNYYFLMILRNLIMINYIDYLVSILIN